VKTEYKRLWLSKNQLYWDDARSCFKIQDGFNGEPVASWRSSDTYQLNKNIYKFVVLTKDDDNYEVVGELPKHYFE
jgi:hypothetical protein